MYAKDRISNIKQMIVNEKKVSVANLSNFFSVTEETIRRDLDKLEEEGVVTRTYGGAILNANHQNDNVQFHRRAALHLAEKQKIALNTLPLIKGKNSLATDASSTVMELLKLLKGRKELTILTNSTEALHVLATSEAKVVSTGGELNKHSLSLQGNIAKETIAKYHVDVFAMSCKGLDLTSGVLDSHENEAETKKAMIAQSSEVILMVDHTKFDKKAFVQLVPLEKVTYLVTDEIPSKSWVCFCEENNIKLIF